MDSKAAASDSSSAIRRMFGDEMLAEWRRAARARRAVLVGLVAALAWTGLQGSRVVYKTFWYWWADPLPIEAPVIWGMDTGHAARLDAFAHRLDACLDTRFGAGEGGVSLAVDPSAAGPAEAEAFFWSLWLAHFLPEHDVRPARPGSTGAGADLRLAAIRDDASEPVCRLGRVGVFPVETAGIETP